MNDMDTDETNELISSDKVEGTVVYNRDGERLGTISNVMIGKQDGQVEYAVLSFGGLFGLGTDHYPLPWSMLEYDTDLGGYAIDLDKDMLKEAPRYPTSDQPDYDRDYSDRINNYYGMGGGF
ncbi:MAG: PRC-barrel domain-containing protein [Sphingobium sp.]|nr:PRC-barrel domain-containing protein [Sphingobium sp.]MBP6111346.1 PRC-barrel domain-containing protein [Sphingobium sp.]MBP8671328.1 PRC-barrel domain-containing protein [Sphingobium sp.]MBP9156664.1 PRC-barrel domain-containing protein [Sphingobium sp.]MCC6481759.1 PRC-barrel domain-containing protein [Sphingomonadaceae bacterium]